MITPTFGFDLERDVRTVEAMAAGLKPYVYDSELYGLMPGDLPKLTVGGLLMRLQRLRAIRNLLSLAQAQTVDTAQKQYETVRKDWAVAYEGKILRELPVRLTSVAQFLEECADSRQRCAEGYPSAIEKRVMAEALKDEALALNVLTPELQGQVEGIDNRIHRFTEASAFRWDARLEPAYPRDKYWFLYSVIPTGK